jgi:hypothetical protein
MKKSMFLGAILATSMLGVSFTQADRGTVGGGGGDIECEAPVQGIAANLIQWIADKGPEKADPRFDLSSSLNPNTNTKRPYTYSEYGEAMTEYLTAPVVVRCLKSDSPENPVKVYGADKICETSFDGSTVQMKCDRELFLGLSQDLKIQQTHHEYAILVPGLEPDVGPISSYKISTQLSYSTEDVLERRVVVKSSCSGDSCAIKPCENLNLRTAPAGTQCITSKQIVFQLVVRTPEHQKEVWKDLNTGLSWSDRLGQTYPQYNGEAACGSDHNTFEARGNLDCVQFHLPKIEDFQKAEADGFREVLPNIGYWFWSSSLKPNSNSSAQEFFGDYGIGSSDSASNFDSIRCVGR